MAKRKHKIFVVDDDPSLIEFYNKYFTQKGYDVISTSDSVTAIESILDVKPDCVILDVMMPRVDGYQLIKQIRAQSELARTKIVVVSAKNYDQDKERAMEMGANGYFVKPINIETFETSVQNLIDDKLKVTIWGARGTLPVPGPDSIKFGGNTMCVTIENSRSIQILDAGSGIKVLSSALLLQGLGSKKKRIYISHPHWDHINALPFFAPLYIQGNEFEILGSEQGDLGMKQIISSQMEGVYFPVKIKEFGSHVVFTDIRTDEFERDGFKVKTMLLNHPGNCLGYRFDYNGKSICYITDNEIYPKDSPSYNMGFEKALISFMESADLVITDATYTDEEYRKKANWGHSSVSEVCRIAHEAKVKRLFLAHHDPDQMDIHIANKEKFAKKILKEMGSKVKCIAPKEGTSIEFL
jgi:phosphoribosyl 1,2-cyclic phosphodiesterase/CheY-like chemotaxis protein